MWMLFPTFSLFFSQCEKLNAYDEPNKMCYIWFSYISGWSNLVKAASYMLVNFGLTPYDTMFIVHWISVLSLKQDLDPLSSFC